MLLWRLTALALLAVCGCGPSCEETYQEYLSHLRARLESCGIDTTGLENTEPETCDGDMQESIECQDDCITQLSCAGLNGTNQAQLDRYVDCITDCPATDL